jgi:hypothetical protein
MTPLELSDNFEALVLALELALTAPSTSQCQRNAVDIADQLAGLIFKSQRLSSPSK